MADPDRIERFVRRAAAAHTEYETFYFLGLALVGAVSRLAEAQEKANSLIERSVELQAQGLNDHHIQVEGATVRLMSALDDYIHFDPAAPIVDETEDDHGEPF